MAPKRARSPKSASFGRGKKGKAEDPVQDKIDALVEAMESEFEYEFPCRDLLAKAIPNVLGKPVETRHEFEVAGARMVTEAVQEALATLKKREAELQYQVNNTEKVKTDYEEGIQKCTTQMAENEKKLAEVEVTVNEADKKLAEDEAKLRHESAQVKEHEDRYQTYQDDFQLLTTTLEEFNQVIASPPEGKKERSKHLSGLEQVFKKFFPGDKALITGLATLLYKGPDAQTRVDKMLVDETQKLFQDELNAFDKKIQEDKPDTTAKTAAAAEVDKSTEHRNCVTSELRELRRLGRSLAQTKKETEVLLKNHPKNVKKWETDLKNMETTIATFNSTVMAAHDFLIDRTEKVDEPEKTDEAEKEDIAEKMDGTPEKKADMPEPEMMVSQSA